MIAHILVDIEVSSRRCIKTGKQLIYYDKQFHTRRLIYKQTFGFNLIFFGIAHAQIFVRLGCHLVFEFGFVLSGFVAILFFSQIAIVQVITGNYGTAVF